MTINMSLIREKLPGEKVEFLKNVTSIRTGLYQDCFHFSGRPSTGSFTTNSTVGLFYNTSSLGAQSFIKTTGSIYSIGSKSNSFNTNGYESPVIILYDRIWSVSVALNITTEQTFTQQNYPRYQGEKLFVWIEITSDTGDIANDRTVTLKYLDQNNNTQTQDTFVNFQSSVGGSTTNCDKGNLHFLGVYDNDIFKSISSIKLSGTVVGATIPTANLVVGKIINILTSSPEDYQINILKNGIVNISTASCLSFITLWETAPNTTTDTIMPIFNFITM